MATQMTNETLDKRLRKAARDVLAVDRIERKAEEYVKGHDARIAALIERRVEAVNLLDSVDALREEQDASWEYLAGIATRRGLDPDAVRREVVAEETAKDDERARVAAEKGQTAAEQEPAGAEVEAAPTASTGTTRRGTKAAEKGRAKAEAAEIAAGS